MEVDIVVVASKLVGITIITPCFGGALIFVVLAHVSVIVNK